MNKLLLVDGNSMLFRAYYATIYGRPMTTSKGIPTNAVFGFASMFQKALDIVQPNAVMVAFDCGKHTFRHDLYEDYKGGRKETPEELIVQFSLIRDYLDAFNITRMEMASIEADDIIGTMSKKYPDWDINILSSDRDLLQLVDDTTSVWLMKKGISDIEENTVESMKESLGIEPKQIIDLKGLMGDASDNIPGIAGVGEKTALKLLLEYGSVENLLEHTSELKGKLKEKVEEFADLARLSKTLATIKTDVDLPFNVEGCLYHPNYTTLVNFFNDMEMKSLVKKYEALITNDNQEITEPRLNEFEVVERCPKELLVNDVVISLDCSNDHPSNIELFGLSLLKDDNCIYIDLKHIKQDEELLKWLNSENHKICYDAKLIYHVFANMDIKFCGVTFDTMIATFLCDSTLTSWDKIRTKYEFVETLKKEEVYGSLAKPKFPDLDEQIKYTSEQAHFIKTLYLECKPLIDEYEMKELFYDIEMPLARVLFNMEQVGILIDTPVLDQIAIDTYKKIEECSSRIFSYVDEEFNINSPKQLAEVLFDKLELPSNKKRSTSVDVLEKLQGFHPIIDDLMEYRKVQKLYSTYAEGLKKYIESDGRIHTIYNQCAAQTGRLSSSDPNLQNISIRDEQARIIRKAFVPSEGNVLISADYSQVELRMLAHMANEKGLIDAFNSKLDIHTKTAMDVFGVDEKEAEQYRRQAKAVNFGIVYGISDFGLSQQLGISRREAQSFIDNYFKAYPGIHSYMDGVIEECKENGYVTTLLNRRREIKEIHDKNHMVREFGKRAAMNAPIQGSAADLIKIAMIHISEEMFQQGCKSKMILQVHDELIFDVTQDEIELMKELIQNGMEHAMELKVPLVAECKVGTTWFEAK